MDRRTLIVLTGAVAGVPVLVVLIHLMWTLRGLHGDVEWHMAIVGAAFLAAVATFFWGRAVLGDRERLRAEGALAEEQYRMVAENAADSIIRVRGSQLVWASPTAAATFGWPREELIGLDIVSHVHPDDLEAALGNLQAIGQGRTPVVRFRLATADGSYRWFQGSGKLYLDSEGNTDGMILAAHRIDEQIDAEQQLEAEKQRLDAMVNNSPSAISVSDLQHRFTKVNDAFCQLFGQKSIEEVIGRTYEELLPPELMQGAQRAWPRLLAGESIVEEEAIHRGSEDTSVMTQRFPICGPDGAVTEVVTIRTDITHRKRALQEIQERRLWEQRIGAPTGDGMRLLTYSQPIVDVATREVVSQELLVRLRLVDTGEILQPNQFLPQCERYRLMPVIDQYMIGRAIEVAGTRKHVNVNVTAQTIADPVAMEAIFHLLASAKPRAVANITFRSPRRPP